MPWAGQYDPVITTTMPPTRTNTRNLPDKYTMVFEPTTIEHLGLKLYSSLPPVIGELVSNAWDAEAPKVWITIPQGAIDQASTVIVSDNGIGMSPAEVQEKYLFIGRNRREAENCEVSANKKRPLTGRKGLGKLSGFGIADRIEMRSVQDGFAVAILLDYQKMRTCPKGQPYEPEIVTGKSGKTKDASGTTVTISALRRQKAIIPTYISKELARRFRFIGSVRPHQGKPIKESERRRKADCREAWDTDELVVGSVVDATRLEGTRLDRHPRQVLSDGPRRGGTFLHAGRPSNSIRCSISKRPMCSLRERTSLARSMLNFLMPKRTAYRPQGTP